MIPSVIAGSAAAGAMSMALEVASRAPHGGIWVVGLIDNPLGYVACILVGTAISTACVIALKSRRELPACRGHERPGRPDPDRRCGHLTRAAPTTRLPEKEPSPMPERTVTVGSSVGLHARPATLFVQAASKQPVKVTIGRPGAEPVDARGNLGCSGWASKAARRSSSPPTARAPRPRSRSSLRSSPPISTRPRRPGPGRRGISMGEPLQASG